MATFGEWGRVAGIALVLVSSSAYATSPSDVATARELYKAGADALDANNPKLAAEKLTQAWSLVQTPVIGADLARAQRSLGHLVEAREAALAVERLPVASDETARSTQARSEADKIATELAPRIPHVKLVVAPSTDTHVTTIKLDGEVIPQAALAVTRQANPGAHVATLDTDDGRHAEGSVTLVEGETKEITLTAPPAPIAEIKPPPLETHPTIVTTPPALVATPPSKHHPSPILWVGIATAGVGLVTGALTGAFAFSEASTVKSNCYGASTTGDGKTVCPPAFTGDLNAANTLGTVSTIGFVTLGVGVALIVVGLVVGGSSDSPKRARILPALNGFAGTF